MENFESAIPLITKNMFMTSVDLRHAYYSVPVATEHQKYLTFFWEGKYYSFTCCPNGLACVPRMFTKLLKPVYAKIRSEGHICTGYIDDTLICGYTKNECKDALIATSSLLQKLGFNINVEKSHFEPTNKIKYLGFVIDTAEMTVSLPENKIEKIETECKKLLSKKFAKIREVAAVIGLLVSSFSAVDYGKLHYHNLETEKSQAVKINKGNFDKIMEISNDMKSELNWWIRNIHTQFRKLNRASPSASIQTDASSLAWGVVFNGKEFGGIWKTDEKNFHINTLEMKAIYYAIKALITKIKNSNVKILTDSTTAVAYINNMGGVRSYECNKIAQEIWSLCIEHNIWICATHIPGIENKADAPSRTINNRTEWSLNEKVFSMVAQVYGTPDIDLFATRVNTKTQEFCSWKPDPYATYIDAFTIIWTKFNLCYIFPPFRLLGQCLQKIQKENARAIIIAPVWPTQPWFAVLMKLIVRNPVILPHQNLLYLPHQNEVQHPLQKTLIMMACLVSGIPSENKDFLEQLPASSCRPGNTQQNASMAAILKNGFSTVIKNKYLQFHPL
jgi:ribonuclease HI